MSQLHKFTVIRRARVSGRTTISQVTALNLNRVMKVEAFGTDAILHYRNEIAANEAIYVDATKATVDALIDNVDAYVAKSLTISKKNKKAITPIAKTFSSEWIIDAWADRANSNKTVFRYQEGEGSAMEEYTANITLDNFVAEFNDNDMSFGGDISIGGTLTVTGESTFNDNVEINGDVSLKNDATLTDNGTTVLLKGATNSGGAATNTQIQGGTGANNQDGGQANVIGGAGTGGGDGGSSTVLGGVGGLSGDGGATVIGGGDGGATSGDGGPMTVKGGDADGAGAGGAVLIQGGTSVGTNAGAAVSMTAGTGGTGAGGDGGDASITGGNAGAGSAGDGGGVRIDAGEADGVGTNGEVTIGGTYASAINVGDVGLQSNTTNAIKAGFIQPGTESLPAGQGQTVAITTYLSNLTSDGDASDETGALADGVIVGQLKKLKMITDGGDDWVVTPANFTDGTTITFANAGEYILLIWDGSGWTTVDIGSDGTPTDAPVIA
jgi:hypothetical protein